MSIFYSDDAVTLHHGKALDVLRSMPDGSVDCCVTSPPYFGLRDYGVDGQQGLEASPAEYVAGMVAVFAEVRRVLADDGTLWLNLGDSYASTASNNGGYSDKSTLAGFTSPDTKGRGANDANVARRIAPGVGPKNLLGIPWRLAFALQDDGWILRNDIIWAKSNGMPEAVQDRLSTKHEHVFMFSKKRSYWFDLDAIRVEYDGDRSLSRRSRTGHTNKENSAQGAWGIHLDRDRPADGSIASAEGMVGNTNAPTPQADRTSDRPQKRRADELFAEAGLTEAHLDAMRAVGLSDAGKALTTQTGAGKNAADMQRLADEAKAALGGYYREFLYSRGRNPGDVWIIPTQPFPGAHFAVMPSALAERCIKAGCKTGGTVLDPYSGSGTTGLAAARHGRKYVGIDLNAEYLDLSLTTRLAQTALIDFGSAS